MAKGKSKYYVVWNGYSPGIYDSWTACQLQIKGFPNAKFKAFKTKAEAEAAYDENHSDHISRKSSIKKTIIPKADLPIIAKSIAVDAACSGNPGLMEYRGVITTTAEQIFHKGPFKDGTNNIGEFLALVHGLAYLSKLEDHDTVIYTDSRTAMAWVRNKKVKTTIERNENTEVLFHLIDRGIKWLKTNSVKNRIIKWETENWGEIPADFGRK